MGWTRRAVLGTTTAVTVAGCLGNDEPESGETDPAPDDGSGDRGPDPTTGEPDGGETSPVVQVASHPELGDVLVGSDGMTLYVFDQDAQGEATSTCYDGCAETRPPLTVGEAPAAGEDVTATLTTFERDDGSMQVAANGWPLYYFAPDEEPGDVEGQGVNDVWWVLSPGGDPIRPSAETETESGGGYY